MRNLFHACVLAIAGCSSGDFEAGHRDPIGWSDMPPEKPESMACAPQCASADGYGGLHWQCCIAACKCRWLRHRAALLHTTPPGNYFPACGEAIHVCADLEAAQ